MSIIKNSGMSPASTAPGAAGRSTKSIVSRWRKGDRVIATVKRYTISYGDIGTSASMRLIVLDTSAGATLAQINGLIGVEHETVINDAFDPIASARAEENRINQRARAR